MPADATLPIGVVIERRDLDNPWQDHSWHPIGIVIGRPSGESRWRQVAAGEGWAQFHVGDLTLELHPGGTEGYLANLSQDPPCVFVVLRPGEAADEEDIEPFLVTVCPFEAIVYGESGDEIVESIAMPPEIVAWVADFVERHPIEQPFRKRKNKRHRDSGLGSRPRGRLTRSRGGGEDA